MDKFDSSEYCKAAVEFARQFGKNFSYKYEDIQDMDDILEIFHKEYTNGRLSDQIAEKIAGSLGVYLGQLLLDDGLSECGYEWEIDSGEPCLCKDSENKIFPLSKTMKRIVNGDSDSVKGFYDVALIIAKKGLE